MPAWLWWTALAMASSGCRFNFDLLGDGGPGGGDGGGGDGGPSGDAVDAANDANDPMDAPAGSSTMMFVGTGSTTDTSINSSSTAFNYGSGTFFNIRSDALGTFNGLVRFDISAIPPTSTVVSAQLRLTTTGTTLSSGSVSFYVMLESWEEGTGVGGIGTANWNDRAAGTAWSTAGAGVGSRTATAFATVQPYVSNMTYPITVPPNVVQSWITTPGSNFGITLVASGAGMADTVGFVSSEGAVGAQPVLSVTTLP